VPAEVKVCTEEVTVPSAPAVRRALEVTEIVEIVPPPFACVATRKKLLKLAPVEAVPLLVIVAVKACATPMVAVFWIGAAAVRLGPVHIKGLGDPLSQRQFPEEASRVLPSGTPEYGQMDTLYSTAARLTPSAE